jgi:APA family basic amino acid/polyamine antiporter
VTITVPQSSPVDAASPDQVMRAESIIEQARLQAGRRVSGHWETVRAGQAGRLIVNEAREMRAAAIVMPLPRRRGTTLFGATIETVLAERPCRVIIESAPADGA